MKKRIIILVVSLIVITGIIIGVSYAFFSAGGKQETANTFTSGCLNISLTDASASINLNNIYPITDIEGLDTTSYDFTITNTCNTDATYEINLESLNQVSNSLSADYLKVSLSSDTVGNVISILSDNTSVTPEIDGAYEAYNLYTGTLKASETKTYHLKLWLDYDATVEVAANKVYQSKINVVANPEIQVVDNLEATFELNDKTLTANLTNNVTSANYCISMNNICAPSTNASIANNNFNIELQGNDNKQMVCTKLNGTSKIICSNPLEVSQTLLADAILAQEGGVQAIESKGTPDFSQTATTDEGIYAAQDEDNKTSYYYRGAVEDNWVQFARFYWRIIRINGDGSIRLIYQGTSANTTGTGTQITLQDGDNTGPFNSSYNRSEYVGLKYTQESQHGTSTNSTIMTELNDWYYDNLRNYVDDIDTNAGFCSDREMASGYSWSSTGSTHYYAARGRLNTNKSPSFKCTNKNSDLFTESSSNQGNKSLQYPIGLITADEVAYAGGVYNQTNENYYLYTNSYYWTMSPYFFGNGFAHVLRVYSDGNLSNRSVNNTFGVRPVINLKADTIISSGDGTSSNPYVVET